MAGTEQMEWHQTPGHVDLSDTIPLILLQSLPPARSPQLKCHQPPVKYTTHPFHEINFDLPAPSPTYP